MPQTPLKPIRAIPLPEEYPGAHVMDAAEEAAVLRVCRSRSLFRYYGLNPQHEADQFEQEFASWAGTRYAVAVTSGTAALHIALSALQVGPGQEVIIPAFLWISVAAAVVNLGAIPVLADVDESFCMDPADVVARITPRTSGIVAVHMCGGHADIQELARIATARNLFLVEDCAESLGGTVNGRPLGTFGDIGIFSFQTNKNINAGEAGALITNDPFLHERVVGCQDIGYPRRGDDQLLLNAHESFCWGRGCRIDELRAAILRVQLGKLPVTLERLRRSQQRIAAELSSLRDIKLRKLTDPEGDTGGFLLTTYPTPAIARRVNEQLNYHHISGSVPERSSTVVADYGLHVYYRITGLVRKWSSDRSGAPWSLHENRFSATSYERGTCPHADDLFERSHMLTIPSCLTRNDEDDIIEAFHAALSV